MLDRVPLVVRPHVANRGEPHAGNLETLGQQVAPLAARTDDRDAKFVRVLLGGLGPQGRCERQARADGRGLHETAAGNAGRAGLRVVLLHSSPVMRSVGMSDDSRNLAHSNNPLPGESNPRFESRRCCKNQPRNRSSPATPQDTFRSLKHGFQHGDDAGDSRSNLSCFPLRESACVRYTAGSGQGCAPGAVRPLSIISSFMGQGCQPDSAPRARSQSKGVRTCASTPD